MNIFLKRQKQEARIKKNKNPVNIVNPVEWRIRSRSISGYRNYIP